jgi:hypothetical protein
MAMQSRRMRVGLSGGLEVVSMTCFSATLSDTVIARFYINDDNTEHYQGIVMIFDPQFQKIPDEDSFQQYERLKTHWIDRYGEPEVLESEMRHKMTINHATKRILIGLTASEQEVWMHWEKTSLGGATLKLWNSDTETDDCNKLPWQTLEKNTHIAPLCLAEGFTGMAFALWKATFIYEQATSQLALVSAIEEYRRLFLTKDQAHTCTSDDQLFIITCKGVLPVLFSISLALN